MSYYEMEKFFKQEAEFAYRDEKGLVKDKIYLGCLSKKLEDQFSKKHISQAIKEGWLKKSYIEKDGEMRNVYAWLEHNVKQRRAFPSFVEKTKVFFQDKVLGPLLRWADFD
jgi:hypothetical protein